MSRWRRAARKRWQIDRPELFVKRRSQIAGQAVALIAKLYEIERDLKEIKPEDRLLQRKPNSEPVVHQAFDAGRSRVGEKVAVVRLRGTKDLRHARQQPRSSAAIDTPGLPAGPNDLGLELGAVAPVAAGTNLLFFSRSERACSSSSVFFRSTSLTRLLRG